MAQANNHLVAAPAPAPSAPDTNGPAPNLAAPVINEPPKSVPEGAGPAVAAPKPVEVTSVPQTPLDNNTPAGGTPRPELNIQEEKPKEKTPEAPVILGPSDGAAKKEPAEPVSDANGPNGVGLLGEKRKAEEETTDLPATNGNPSKSSEAEKNEDQRPEKKPKVTDKIADKVADVKDKVTGGASEKKKPGRPKKDKKAPPPVGRTERKTRSQVAAEASTS